MSLVNKMLRDLDARRVGAGDRAALPAAVTPLAARRAPGRNWTALLLGTSAAVAVLGVAAWYGAGSLNPAAPAAVPVVPALPATAPVAALAPVAVVAPAPAAQVPVTEAAPIAAVAATSLRMADELSAAPKVIDEPPRKAVAVAVKAAERPKSETVRPNAVAPTPVRALPEASIDKQVRLPSAAERAEAEYRRGLLAQRQGNSDAAAGLYRIALADNPDHAAARQALAAMLIESRSFDEAEEVLRQGTELASVRLPSTLALARLKVERNRVGEALELLQKNSASGERSAEYQGFVAALLNRAGRKEEAIEHYQAATRLSPNDGRWWASLGIALDAAGKGAEAREAYRKARGLPDLPADLAQHVEQRLR